MTATVPSQMSIEERLYAILTTDGYERVRAFLDALNANLGGVKIADHHCGHRDEPLVMTLQQLMRHLVTNDSPRQVATRGFRMHTPVNVTVHDPDDPGRGPALGRGPA